MTRLQELINTVEASKTSREVKDLTIVAITHAYRIGYEDGNLDQATLQTAIGVAVDKVQKEKQL